MHTTKLENRIENLIAQMSVAEKVGQLFLMAYTHTDTEYAKFLISEYHVGGFYISNDNADTHEQAFALVATLNYEAQKRICDAPLLLGVDQEGAWSVLSKTSTPGAGNLALGAADDTAITESTYTMFATEMKAVGYNTILAPCADVNSNPNNPIIGVRSFGETPQLVASHVQSAITGLKKGGVLATAKHFPGHGDTGEDTHRLLPTVDKSLEALMVQDLVPFQAAIDAGVDIIMTSHILFPHIDPKNPATLSKRILQDILRKKMGFDGIIVTDSMNMWAMRKNYDPADSAIQALKSGATLIMLSEEHYENSLGGYKQKQQHTINGVIKAVQSGDLDIKIIDDALRLVLKYRYYHPAFQIPSTLDTSTYGTQSHYDLAYKGAKKAVKILRNAVNAWPLPKGTDFILVATSNPACQDKILECRGIGPNDEKLVIEVLQQQLDKNKVPYTPIDYDNIPSFLNSTNTDTTPIVLITENYPIAGYDHDVDAQAEIVRQFIKIYGDRVIVIALRSAYELDQYQDLKTYICTYSSRPISAQVIGDILSD